ncbi:type III secretion system gatekeeper subunit SctW [Noviherbaspirillum sp.]|uniref:type III secretion system gatekeeper subunit SctW n=1 Tax=Noviherbaspirillum sp. TaxID=1926288 RepID=UPI002B48C556|nr:type III secretion system gatekeeper subunit SctW [Noviherbaspirillum sp.]HJV80581.1 type III secretion system gatekeeper subunit SctW [Noviherbaspirillum sp.]
MSTANINGISTISTVRVEHAVDVLSAQSHFDQVPAQGAGVPGQKFNLTDAAEELGFAHQERAEDKKLDEFELTHPQADIVQRAAKIEELLQILGKSSNAEDAASFAARLIDIAGQRLSLLAAVRNFSRDPTRQYLALEHAYHMARANGSNPDVVEALRDAVEWMHALHAPTIRADINTVAEATAFSQEPAAADMFRTTYRDAVLGQATFSATLALVLERFGDELERGVDLLRKALGSDLASIRPSSEPERLHAILQDLYQLSAAVAVLQRCRNIVEWLKRAYPVLNLKPVVLMTDLVKFTAEQWIESHYVLRLIQKYGLDIIDEKSNEAGIHSNNGSKHSNGEEPDEDDPGEFDDDEPKAQVLFLNGVLDILRSLPPKIFSGDEQRLQTIAAVQQLIDSLLLAEGQ